MIRKILACSALLLLVGCASLGLAPASSFGDRLAYSYGTHTAVLVAATQSLEAGELDSADASRVLKVADEARTALDAAKLAHGVGDASTAEGRLQLATALLTNLQAYLRAPR